jgi:hypothetical protein
VKNAITATAGLLAFLGPAQHMPFELGTYSYHVLFWQLKEIWNIHSSIMACTVVHNTVQGRLPAHSAGKIACTQKTALAKHATHA